MKAVGAEHIDRHVADPRAGRDGAKLASIGFGVFVDSEEIRPERLQRYGCHR
jgi:hypothetical protein